MDLEVWNPGLRCTFLILYRYVKYLLNVSIITQQFEHRLKPVPGRLVLVLEHHKA
jgi:hypothetical protein